MTQNQSGPAGNRNRLPPERWELVKNDAILRAQEARAQMLRQFGRWIGAQATGGVRRLVGTLRSWRRRQVAAFELGSLDDRSLRDLGINRSEIQSVVAGWDSTRIPRGQIAARLPREAATVGRKPRATRPAIQKNAA